MSVKILILNTSESNGGAAIAAKRLHIALNKYGNTSKMLVLEKKTDETNIISLNHTKGKAIVNKIRFIWERLIIFINNKFSRKNLFKVSLANTGTDISTHPLVKEADVLHIHWINQGFLSLKDIQKLLELNKPIVWTLHDLWPGTGICHYPDECKKYQTICHTCPQLIEHPWVDVAKTTYVKKQKISFLPIHFVGCSRWITETARLSGLLKNNTFYTIPNPIDCNRFSPQEKASARKKMGLPLDKQLLIFAAANIYDSRKGLSYLIEACKIVKQEYSFSQEPEIVLLGKGSDELLRSLPLRTHCLGYLSDTSDIINAYAAADLFVIPSLEDNLPNTIMEALACGLPCCGFNIGGIPEMIDHKINGYVAKEKDIQDLANGIQWILTHPEKKQLSKASREKVEKNYNEKIIAEQYTHVYKQLLK